MAPSRGGFRAEPEGLKYSSPGQRPGSGGPSCV